MNKLFWCGALTAALSWAATPASAGELNLTIANGRVTLIAQDVTVRQILAEWARVGQTQILNGDKILGGPVTMELKDVPEAKALDIVLRSAAGYILAPRLTAQTGGSEFGKIMILATSQPPPVSAAPPSFNAGPRPIPQQFVPPAPADTGDDSEPPNMVPPPGQPVPGQFTQPGQFNQPGVQPDPMQVQPAQPVPQGPVTAPRPGPLPQQPTAPGTATPGSPFQTQPGVRPPGTQPPNRPGGGGEGVP